MKDRIKAVRKALNLTQQAFADKMGMQRATLSKYEAGKNLPSATAMSLICRTFDVNEVWLRTGKGEMFTSRTREEEIAAYMGRITGGKGTEVENAIIAVMARTTGEEWEIIAKKAQELVAEMHKEKPDQS